MTDLELQIRNLNIEKVFNHSSILTKSTHTIVAVNQFYNDFYQLVKITTDSNNTFYTQYAKFFTS